MCPQSQRARDDKRLLGLLKHVWLESGGVYGYRKLTIDMRDLGESCSKHRVARLLKREGLQAQRGYPLSLRHIEEMMAERGVPVDHATVYRWSIKMIPVLAAALKTRKLSVGSSWRMDETYILVSGQWKYLYRAVDAQGQTVDFLLSAKRDAAAAGRFLERAIGLHGAPQKMTIDKSGANKAAIFSVEAAVEQPIELCQINT